MPAFQWDDCFATGLADVDKQHQRLIDLINRFGELVMRVEGASALELEVVFAELAQYAQFHFAEEEALMAASGLTPQYVEGHRQKHRKFIAEVTLLYEGITSDNRSAAKGLLEFLTNWLAYHILGTDQFMARQIVRIESGDQMQHADPADKRPHDPAKDALLSALNGLFQQVSDRNHELVELNKTLETRVAERTQALTERTMALLDANQQLDAIANTDVLTQLPNRRHAMRSFKRVWLNAVSSDTALACMMVDADGFKQVNDSHGHDAGDLVLHALSKELRNAVRTDDLVCRLGGDEFLIICWDTPMDGALQLAEKIRLEVAALRVSAGTGEWRGSISVGVAVRTAGMKSMDDLLKAADLGVYAAKRRGRNRVAVAD
jgi:diguanylate cyclase (GGDEF)-like protein/hemerythrin-like metal-binding protein